MSETCPKCGSEMYQSDKHTDDGTDWREYTCRSCGHVVERERGKALWAILSEDRENAQAVRKLSVGANVVLTTAGGANALPAGTRGRVISVDLGQGRIELETADPPRKVRVEARLVTVVSAPGASPS